MTDTFGREIDYLRISVTDRCNFRCIYCMPKVGVPWTPHTEMLASNEIVRLARIGCEQGIKKIRLTGGEPLVRPDILSLVRSIAALDGLQDLSLTTNGS